MVYGRILGIIPQNVHGLGPHCFSAITLHELVWIAKGSCPDRGLAWLTIRRVSLQLN
jgi:hypothetical protein